MGVQRTVFRGLPLAFLIFAFAAPASAATTIGLYTDENGSSCSFSGNQSGIVNAYVILKPDNLGIRGVRFSAPVPACFGGTWVSDTAPFGAAYIGDSPRDISVAFASCAIEPAYALQIQYVRTSTEACCAFPIVASQGASFIEGITCNYDQASMLPVVSHFNADSSCPCSDPNPPHPPENPVPTNSATGVALGSALSWSPSILDSDIVSYDVYFGTNSTPPFVANVTTPTYQPAQALQEGTAYYWRIVARDSDGLEASGPVWAFTTRLGNRPPTNPANPTPVNTAVNVLVGTTLKWSATDPDGDVMVYDVYFGTAQSPPLVAQNVAVKSYQPAMSFVTKYYWKIVARDAIGLESPGPVWSFTTASNSPPMQPTAPSPVDGATSVPLNSILSWTSTDELPGLNYDVYFGANTTSPPLVASHITTNSFNPGALAFTTTYRWRIVARDAQGLQTTGVLWTFYTPAPPTAFSPSPADNGFGASPQTLSWTCSRPNVQPVHCDLYFGTTNPPPLVASALNASVGVSGFSYSVPGEIVVGTSYYWRVYSYDSFGSSMGSVWTFVGGMKGDIDRDGFITVSDASCALQIALGNTACATGATASLADVNCAVGVTPRDALCIHRRAIGQTCLFCGESETAGPATGPVVTRSAYWQTGNNIYVNLAVSGVPTFEAWSFQLRTPTNAPLTMVTPIGLTTGFTALTYTSLSSSIFRVGGYTLTAGDGSATTDFIQLRFTVSGSMTGFIVAETFIDDLFGAASMTLISGSGKGGGGETPVTFSRFDATPDEGGVRIAWEMRFVDAAESYTLYRHENGRTPLAIASGAVRGATGSYVDRTVEVGKTYQYEMLVRSAAGEDVRSQLVTVTVPTLGLVLGPNHPNPFNPQTTIPYFVPAAGGQVRVRLAIYDTSGRAVRVLVNEDQAGGAHDVVWRGNDETGAVVSSGIYFCVLQVGNERRAQKLVLLK